MPPKIGYGDVTPPVDFTKPIDTSAVTGKTSIVTGGASGIGLHIARALAVAGAFVAIADKSVELGETAAEELRRDGHKAIFVETDVASYDAQLAMFKQAIAAAPNGRVDIVVASAGLTARSFTATLENLDADDDPPPPDLKIVEVNGIGSYYTTYLAAHFFRKAAAGPPAKDGVSSSKLTRPQVLLVGSTAGYGEDPLNSSYAFSKYGVRGLLKTLRRSPDDLGGMRINLLAPWFVETPLIARKTDALRKAGLKLATTGDSTSGAMRLICDESCEGRAVCIAPGEGKDGSANFDVMDDFIGKDDVWMKRFRNGVFGDIAFGAGY